MYAAEPAGLIIRLEGRLCLRQQAGYVRSMNSARYLDSGTCILEELGSEFLCLFKSIVQPALATRSRDIRQELLDLHHVQLDVLCRSYQCN